MNISGILITASPEKCEGVVNALRMLPQCDVTHQFPDGRIVAVLERASTHEEVRTVKDIHAIDGVLSAMMVYHNFEEETGGS